MGLIVRDLGQSAQIPKYTEQKAQAQVARGGMRATLGTVPDYAGGVKGVLLGSTRKGTPADKAGIKGGDIVVELAGKKIDNIYDYTDAISALKVGMQTTIVIVRDGKRKSLKITPVSRD